MSRSSYNLSRLSISLLLVLGLHIGLGVLALNWRVEAAPVELPPAAMLLELAPQPAVAASPLPATAQPASPEPELVVAPKPTLVLQKPKPKPAAKPIKPRPSPPAPVAKPVSQAAPTAATAAAAAAASAADQPSVSASRAMAATQASWQSRLLSHLGRYKNYPDIARRRGIEGTCLARFTLDRSGRVLSVELTESSGNVAIDRATLAMIRRASPVPTPPMELLSGGQMEIVAPFIYALEPR